MALGMGTQRIRRLPLAGRSGVLLYCTASEWYLVTLVSVSAVLVWELGLVWREPPIAFLAPEGEDPVMGIYLLLISDNCIRPPSSSNSTP